MVSVIIPTYNRPEMLVTALRSVLAQTYRDLEVIVVDDCSREPAADVLNRYFAEEMRTGTVRSLRNETNKDKSFSRNRGVAQARGAWLAFLDDDDEWLPMHLRVLVDLAAEHPDCRILFSNFTEVKSGAVVGTGQTISCGGGKAVRDLCIRGVIGNVCYTLMDKDLFSRCGGFDERLDVYEDRLLLATAALHTEVYFSETKTLKHVIHDGSFSFRSGSAAMARSKAFVADEIVARARSAGYRIEPKDMREMYLNVCMQMSDDRGTALKYWRKALRSDPTGLLSVSCWRALVRALFFGGSR